MNQNKELKEKTSFNNFRRNEGELIMFNTKKAQQLKEQGNKLFGRQQYRQAIESYQAAIKIDLELKAAWFNMGLAWQKINESAEALAAFTKAVEIDPNYIKALWHHVTCRDICEKSCRAKCRRNG